MIVSVKTYANLRSITGKDVVDLRMEGTPDVGDVLNRLVERYGEETRKFISGDRVVLLINGMNVTNTEGLNRKIQDGDWVTVLPVLSGG